VRGLTGINFLGPFFIAEISWGVGRTFSLGVSGGWSKIDCKLIYWLPSIDYSTTKPYPVKVVGDA
jgi:hypothetical protein